MVSTPPSGIGPIVAAVSGEELRELGEIAEQMHQQGIRRIHTLAWRDLDDPDGGGSEVHADEFMTRWAAAGFDVLHRTSAAVGQPAVSHRNGYDVIRRGSRYTVFPRAIAAEMLHRMGPFDALVEIWNGVPWFSPIWCRKPRITFLHHVHGPMWDQMLPGPLAACGRALETRLAPPFYRRSPTVTPSEATREELLEIGFLPEHVTAVPNGTDARFSPGGRKSEHPSLVAVCRLAPVKRLGLLIDAAVIARAATPGLTLTIVGNGPSRPELESKVNGLGAGDWIKFTGRVDQADLVDLYRRSWLVVSASLAEGWGLSLTEGAGCGTAAVATNIRGHRSSVVDGVTGILAEPSDLGNAIARVLCDHDLRVQLASAAQARVRSMTWDASALGILRVLAQTAK
jgi:glycosyltransferase involved in cell wall biosynthesis|tara:strand:+ start:194 stop:1390 length:1197 start_codon:yes stop_codon:yes gene_type:complete